MKSFKSRFLDRFKSIPSMYTSKQHILVPIPLSCKSPDRFSTTLTQQNHTNTREQENYGHIMSNDPLVPTIEIDVFEECECEFDDSMPEMVSSSSSSSSCNSSPTRENCKDTENDLEGTQELLTFKEMCPPGGIDRVVLYTTSLRGIRKTFEDCQAIKFLLDSFRVLYHERDVSMHLLYRDELWKVLGGRVLPPRLFIKGRYIGGADEVVMLNEVGMLKKLLQGMPGSDLDSSVKCFKCGGFQFFVCSDCNGSCKVYKGDQGNEGSLFVKCTKCNENGLIICSCSY
ncbi:uncharacterized protein At5g39865-like [Amaranthus tricolor]|uniref:uncharacterized protein At5g39865-like n=1 Tax=Amaranthus tricolor TaxID=29722 RepID=UPI0025837409|nr:uncharacterized protein At5g39865-like [Amaranthus tricolor]